MTQMYTQTKEYWASPDLSLTESDIEQIYNYFLEVERPQPIEKITRVIIKHRIAEEKSKLKPRMEGRIIYQPRKQYQVGDKLVFPALQFAHAEVTELRKGTNPQFGEFQVIAVNLNGKAREFSAGLEVEHPLNRGEGMDSIRLEEPDPDALYEQFGEFLNERISAVLEQNNEFIRLAGQWFVRGLMGEINIGHLHLSEAVLEISGGGPLPTPEILVHLDMPKNILPEVQEFSLNYALLNDARFDEVAPPGRVSWFLRRLEPAYVREVPDRLAYKPHAYDRALLGSQMHQLERELDDEWSEFEWATVPRDVTFTLTYPHRAAGTLPLSSRLRAHFPLGISPRQLVTLVDKETDEEIPAWVSAEGRYVGGLTNWYEANDIPVGGYLKVSAGPRPGVVYIDYSRRPKARREWVRLGSIQNGQLAFHLDKRNVGCDYDDLLIVSTEQTTAVDLLFRSGENQRRTLASLLAQMMPSLGESGPQNAVHAKTLYSAVNMLRRTTPGAIFAELIRHPAFQTVGDQYWLFNPQKWQN